MRVKKYHEKVVRRQEYNGQEEIDRGYWGGSGYRGEEEGEDSLYQEEYDDPNGYDQEGYYEGEENQSPVQEEPGQKKGKKGILGRRGSGKSTGQGEKGSGPKKKRTLGDMLLTGLLVLAVGVFLYAAFNLIHIYTEYKKGSNEYNAIAKMAVTEKEANDSARLQNTPLTNSLQAPMSIDFTALREINEDVIGWIYIEALEGVNYPIVRGIDNNYYLHLTYQKNYNYAGTIFMDKDCKEDFSDCNTLIYGHNMQDGSMFGKLKRFSSSMEAYEKSKYFWIFTPEYDYRYEIVSAYTTAVDSFTYTLFKGPGEEFIEYLTKLVEASEIPTNTENLSVNDKIITLSTCTGNEATRYVVQGRRVDTIRRTS